MPRKVSFVSRAEPLASSEDVVAGVRSKYAPRYSDAGRRTAFAALSACAKASGVRVEIFLQRALLRDEQWLALGEALAREGGPLAVRSARDVLAWHRDAAQKKRRISSAKVRHVMRPLYRGGNVPPLASIGVEPAAAVQPSSFAEYLDDEEDGPQRTSASGRGPGALAKAWGLGRVAGDGVICPLRAAERVATWRKGARKAAGALPPLSQLQSLVRFDVLPTALANVGDHYWLAGRGRWMSVTEMLRVWSTPASTDEWRALCDDAIVTPAQAARFIGESVHPRIAECIVSLLIAERSLPADFSYGATCCCVDFFRVGARAAAEAAGGRLTQLFAVEKDPLARRVLAEVANVPPEALYEEATSRDAVGTCSVDLWVFTPDCGPHSPRSRAAEAVRLDAWDVARRAFEYALNARPRCIVVENVGGRDNRDAFESIVRSASAYAWREQPLDALEHGGVPVSRRRVFWVGVRV